MEVSKHCRFSTPTYNQCNKHTTWFSTFLFWAGLEWVLFQKNCTALWHRSRTQLFPLISICQLVTEHLSGSFVGLSGLHHICCAMSGDLSREDCVHNTNWVPKKAQITADMDIGQKAPAHLVDRPTELICITNINTREDMLSPKYQAVSSVFLNIISHRGPAMSIHLTCCFL